MPTWIMKTGDDTYRLWSTVVDDWMSDPLAHGDMMDVAIARACEGDPLAMTPDLALVAAEETMRFVDEHLCSCRARLGENVEALDYDYRTGVVHAAEALVAGDKFYVVPLTQQAETEAHHLAIDELRYRLEHDG